ncbi:protein STRICTOSIDINE SYNTHASE-LIKE 4 [Cryptomeria japonica]|uniref:protein STRICTOSIDINE SYNTHASE-LIKE 4 n=1 Tax=Cryptomeria japonica TaxID=3369 RepID=UPI0027D9DE06|nr:protein STRICTOSIDINE SYNTHASE-LIKE 4 [Cryptomeria japonica]
MSWITPSTVATAVSACLVAWLLQIIAYSPISLGPSIFQSDYKSEGHFVKNNVLQSVEKLGEGFLYGPEDLAVDSNGLIYTATQDGWIKRMHPNGSWEEWKEVGGSLLGLTVSKSGHIIVCDPARGLLKVSDEEVSVIASEIEGEKIRFVDAVVESSDGSLYFSDASTKFPYSQCILDFVEGVPYGRLLKYDPKTKKTSVLLDGLGFANGVALSASEDYVAICETWKFRCLKYWIKGEKSGKTEVLVDNLPGGPDNINLASDGHSYWIAILKLRIKAVQFMFEYPILRHIFARYPSILNWFGVTTGWAMVAKVGEDGTIIKMFDDSNGKVISFVTSAMEVGEYLYLGNLNTKFLGRLNLK